MELLTEQQAVPGPVVYGYLRLTKPSAARQAALTEALAEYCRQRELLLVGVFTEQDLPEATRPPTAFTALLDVLALPGIYGVVAPTVAHLGPQRLASAREKQIVEMGGRLLLLRGGSAGNGSRVEAAALPEGNVGVSDG
ncbi:hypothetical protein AB0C14_37600 [Microbispora hainanensis]|uniref:hypothetical protein n=1 Tax=Microbispora hainanensis TaxID=568844 RepID=UPI0033D3F4BD